MSDCPILTHITSPLARRRCEKADCNACGDGGGHFTTVLQSPTRPSVCTLIHGLRGLSLPAFGQPAASLPDLFEVLQHLAICCVLLLYLIPQKQLFRVYIYIRLSLCVSFPPPFCRPVFVFVCETEPCRLLEACRVFTYVIFVALKRTECFVAFESGSKLD